MIDAIYIRHCLENVGESRDSQYSPTPFQHGCGTMVSYFSPSAVVPIIPTLSPIPVPF